MKSGVPELVWNSQNVARDERLLSWIEQHPAGGKAVMATVNWRTSKKHIQDTYLVMAGKDVLAKEADPENQKSAATGHLHRPVSDRDLAQMVKNRINAWRRRYRTVKDFIGYEVAALTYEDIKKNCKNSKIHKYRDDWRRIKNCPSWGRLHAFWREGASGNESDSTEDEDELLEESDKFNSDAEDENVSQNVESDAERNSERDSITVAVSRQPAAQYSRHGVGSKPTKGEAAKSSSNHLACSCAGTSYASVTAPSRNRKRKADEEVKDDHPQKRLRESEVKMTIVVTTSAAGVVERDFDKDSSSLNMTYGLLKAFFK